MRYLITHPEEFTSTTEPFISCCLLTIGTLVSELTNMFMIAKMNDVSYCIIFFVAFHVLTAIDNILAESFSELHLLEALEEPIFWKRKIKDVSFKTPSCKLKCFKFVW